MIVLLPPSETKRPGGEGAALDLAELAFPSLEPQRAAALDALVALNADEDEAARALKLSARQRGEVEVNAAVRTSATMPAIDRFTGVLFDALDAASLSPAAREWLGANAIVQTALLGPVGALDPIPAFRLSAGGRLPGLSPLKRHWAETTTAALGALGARLIVDLRSEAYRGLGPVPVGAPQTYVRVVADSGDGEVRALNHFNKRAKGLLVRALAQAGKAAATVPDLVAIGGAAGFEMRPSEKAGETLLVAGE